MCTEPVFWETAIHRLAFGTAPLSKSWRKVMAESMENLDKIRGGWREASMRCPQWKTPTYVVETFPIM